MIAKITRAYTRTYSDSGQTTCYVEWEDRNGRAGRTEGAAVDGHMAALLARAKREGVPHETQRW